MESTKAKAKFDPSDCHNPVRFAIDDFAWTTRRTTQVCGSKMQMFSSTLARARQQPTPAQELECPVDRDELGRSTWNLLHTTAAYYPEQPDDSDQRLAGAMIQGLAKQ